MLRAAVPRTIACAWRSLHTSPQAAAKVAVLGAAGGIGQPLSLLLKQSPLVTELALYDIAHAPGVAADLSHINTPAKVYSSADLAEVLTGCTAVIIPAGVPRKPGMTRDDLFNTNAGIVQTLAEACAEHCPKALVGIISNPVNSTVPIFAEAMKRAGVYDKNRVFGVTTLDIVRANTFVAEKSGADLSVVDVPVIGGHSGITILPVLSQCTPPVNFDAELIDSLTVRIQNAGTEVVEAKQGKGSATLSMAMAGARFVFSLLKGAKGDANVTEHAYINTDVVPGVNYFSTKVQLGPNGVAKVYPLPSLTEYEATKLKEMIPELQKNIQKGEAFKMA